MIDREWAHLTLEQKKYLLQIRGPHDMFQNILRDFVTVGNLSTAAILYDETFGKVKTMKTFFTYFVTNILYHQIKLHHIQTAACLF